MSQVTVPKQVSPVIRQAIDSMRGGATASLRIVDQLLSEHPDERDLIAYRVLAMQWTGKPDEGLALAVAELDKEPRASLYAVAAGAEQIKGNTAVCEDYLKKAMALDSQDFLVFWACAAELQMAGRFAEALACLRECLALYPEVPEVYSSISTTLQQSGDLVAAQRWIDECPEWFRNTGSYHSRKGLLALQQRDLATAEEQLRFAVAASPEDSSFWGYLGMVLRFVAKIEESERASNYAIELNPRQTIALKTLAQIYKQRGEKTKADEYFARAENSIGALAYLAKWTEANKLRHSGKPLEAAKLMEEMLAQCPDGMRRSPMLSMPGVYIQAERWDDAQKAYEDALAQYGECNELALAHLNLSVHRDELDDAEHIVEQLLSKQPVYPDAYGSIIEFLLKKGDRERVVALHANLLTELPGTPASIANVIIKLSVGGEKELARSLHAAAIRKYPDAAVLRMLSVSFSAEDDDLKAVLTGIKSLPKEMRQELAEARLKKLPPMKRLMLYALRWIIRKRKK